ncbi:MAG: hypothetical protein ACI8SE_001636 [Bacteroidia bacterium]|jgi:hypothetical protein
MIHPNTELRFISQQIGYGVVATKHIPKGTITWVQDHLDQVFTEQQLLNFSLPYKAILNTYCFKNRHGNHVLCWDHSRFVNHSFRSNCISTAYDFEIAIRDIEAGEQLTDDYGYLNISEPFIAEPENTKRTIVFPDDLLHYSAQWDAQIEVAIAELTQHEQPLKWLFTQDRWDQVLRFAKKEESMDSISTNYYKPTYQDAC